MERSAPLLSLLTLFLFLCLHPCLNLFISLLFSSLLFVSLSLSLSYPVLILYENCHLHLFAYCLPGSCFCCCKSTICAAKLKDALSDPAALGCIGLPYVTMVRRKICKSFVNEVPVYPSTSRLRQRGSCLRLWMNHRHKMDRPK